MLGSLGVSRGGSKRGTEHAHFFLPVLISRPTAGIGAPWSSKKERKVLERSRKKTPLVSLPGRQWRMPFRNPLYLSSRLSS